MSSLCEYMLQEVRTKLKESKVRPPILRRQIAGNLDNPYDLDDIGNLDIKLYVQDFFAHYGTNPPPDHIESLAVFPTTENLVNVQHYLKTILSKL